MLLGVCNNFKIKNTHDHQISYSLLMQTKAKIGVTCIGNILPSPYHDLIKELFEKMKSEMDNISYRNDKY